MKANIDIPAPSAIVDGNTADLAATLTETIVKEAGKDGIVDADLTQGAGQTVSGKWLAADVDSPPILRLFSGDNEIGTINTVNATETLTFIGRYGTITFSPDGTWTYVLTARAEKIAAGQTPDEVFALTVRDEYGEKKQRNYAHNHHNRHK